MVITLSVITATIFMGAVLEVALEELRDRVDVRIVFNVDASPREVRDLQEELENRPEVLNTERVSRDQTLESFRRRHQDDETVLQALDELGDNPFGASVTVRAEDPDDYEALSAWISTTDYYGQDGIIYDLNFEREQHQQAIRSLSRFMDGVERIGLIAAIVLIVISVLITFNTIRLTIHSSADERAVMRLVGASVGYIRGPFVVSGILYGIAAAVITLAIFYPLTFWVGDVADEYFGGLDLFRYYLNNLGEIIVLITAAGIFVGAVSSYLAVKRYLKV